MHRLSFFSESKSTVVSIASFTKAMTSAYNAALTYCIFPLEKAIFGGELAKFILKNDTFTTEALADAKQSPSGVAVKSIYYKQYGFVVPKPDTNYMRELLDKLDVTPNGRKPYKVLNTLTHGNHFLSMTLDPLQHVFRQKLMQMMQPDRFVLLTQNAMRAILQDGVERTFEQAATQIVQQMFLKAFFNLDVFPEGIDKIVSITEKSFKYDFLFFLPKVRKEFQALQADYERFAHHFMLSQASSLLNQLREYSSQKQSENLIVELLVELIREKNPGKDLQKVLKMLTLEQLQQYLQDPMIKALPSFFMAGENLIRLISHLLGFFSEARPEDFAQIKRDFQGIIFYDKEDKIIPDALRESDDIEYQLRWRFLDYMRWGMFDLGIIRYAEHKLDFHGTSIPDNTVLFFKLNSNRDNQAVFPDHQFYSEGNWKSLVDAKQSADDKQPNNKLTRARARAASNRAGFMPFSTGKRSCPAQYAVERVFYVVFLECFYRFRFNKVGNDKLKVTFLAPAQSVAAQKAIG